MVIEALSEWNHWWRSKSVEKDLIGKERIMLKELVRTMQLREIKLIIGVRRSGKSTLFYQLIDKLINSNINPEEILLINFEDDVLANKSLSEIFDSYQSNINPDIKPYIFLDEVHRCKEWVPFLRKLYDLRKTKQIFITDSSSEFVKSEYARVLTGRNISLPIFPLSFKEYLEWKNIKFSRHLSREEINKINNGLSHFLRWGGFPEVFFKDSAFKKKLLTEYFSDIIYKDIIGRYNVSYAKIKPLADFCISNIAVLFSPRKYSRTFGLSLESINTYLGYFIEVSLFYFLPRYSESIKAQQLSPKKVYICDVGFFNNIGFRFSENIGRVYENVVFIELKRTDKDLYYWKNKYECDFLVKEGIRVKEAIQVCFNLTNDNKEREINGLLEVLKKFKLKRGLLITNNYEHEHKIKNKLIKFMPLWKWLLEKT